VGAGLVWEEEAEFSRAWESETGSTHEVRMKRVPEVAARVASLAAFRNTLMTRLS